METPEVTTHGVSGGGGKRPAPVKPNHESIAKLAHQMWEVTAANTTADENWEAAEEQLWFTFVRAVDNFRGEHN